MKRSDKVLVFVVAPAGGVLALLLLASAVRWIAMCVNAYNPMQTAFMESFEVVNGSGARVWITPVGMWQGSGRYGPLPRYRDDYPPARPAGRSWGIPLEPGDSIQITYDWDDVNSRHILVRTDSGRCLIVDTDRKGTLDACYGPQKEKYAIPPLAELAEAPVGLIPCARGRYVSYAGAKEYPE